MSGMAAAVMRPPPKNGSKASCLYPNASYAGDSFSGSAIRMRMRPVAVTPIDCPKSPIPRSNQYLPMTRGASSNRARTLQASPATDRMRKGCQLSAMAASERVARALTMRMSSASPWIRNIIWWSMMPPRPVLSSTIWTRTPPSMASGKSGTNSKISMVSAQNRCSSPRAPSSSRIPMATAREMKAKWSARGSIEDGREVIVAAG